MTSGGVTTAETSVAKPEAWPPTKILQEQQMLRAHIVTFFRIERDNLCMAPFERAGDAGKMFQPFDDRKDSIITNLNEALTA